MRPVLEQDYVALNEMPSNDEASLMYAVPNGSDGTSNAAGAEDAAYGGVIYVAALNQSAPEYATAVETGSADALYPVVDTSHANPASSKQ